jgi:hypothetical protein
MHRPERHATSDWVYRRRSRAAIESVMVLAASPTASVMISGSSPAEIP